MANLLSPTLVKKEKDIPWMVRELRRVCIHVVCMYACWACM